VELEPQKPLQLVTAWLLLKVWQWYFFFRGHQAKRTWKCDCGWFGCWNYSTRKRWDHYRFVDKLLITCVVLLYVHLSLISLIHAPVQLDIPVHWMLSPALLPGFSWNMLLSVSTLAFSRCSVSWGAALKTRSEKRAQGLGVRSEHFLAFTHLTSPPLYCCTPTSWMPGRGYLYS